MINGLDGSNFINDEKKLELTDYSSNRMVDADGQKEKGDFMD